MRAWAIGFLLAMTSFQSAWAGVAAYCQHRADVVPYHIGHHEHGHAALGGPDADDGPSRVADTPDANLGSVDNDCGGCHLRGAQPLAAAVEPWSGHGVHELVSTALLRYRIREPEGLERPKWQRLARSASLEEQHST